MTLHYSANNCQMMDGDVVYIDYGADYEYYTSDDHADVASVRPLYT